MTLVPLDPLRPLNLQDNAILVTRKEGRALYRSGSLPPCFVEHAQDVLAGRAVSWYQDLDEPLGASWPLFFDKRFGTMPAPWQQALYAVSDE
jgi:hypothetical protein